MLEAVNTVIANAPLVRDSAEQTSSAAFSTSNEPVTQVAKAPYVSLFVHVDNDFDKAILQVRDSDTGNVIDQYPSEETLAQRQRAAQRQAQLEKGESVREDSQLATNTTSSSGQNTYVQAQTIASADAATSSSVASASSGVDVTAALAAVSQAASSPSSASGSAVSINA